MPKLPGSFRIAATLAGAAEVPTILSGKAATRHRIPSVSHLYDLLFGAEGLSVIMG